MENGNKPAPRQKRSDRPRGYVKTLSKATLQNLANQVTTLSSLCRALGVADHGGARETVRVRLKELAIDTSHFRFRPSNLDNINAAKRLRPEALYTKGKRSLKPQAIIEHLVEDGLKTGLCEECSAPPEWRGKPMRMKLEYLNGDMHDNRLENLRILCPNCQGTMPLHAKMKGGFKSAKTRKIRQIDRRYAELAAELKRGY